MSKHKDFFKILTKRFLSNSSGEENEDDLERIAAQEQKLFPFETLVAATKNFQLSQKLGEGPFGPVYKGKLGDGREIAVKRLLYSSTLGKKEFKAKAKSLARVHHRNVVNLLGYCVNGSENLLVYEYVANKSLDKHLFKDEGRESLNWKARHDVIVGIAKGLRHLHEMAHCHITHRDIKASNILLDNKWVPKISDFGMALLFPENDNTRVVRTDGYMAPEYLMLGFLSAKADVFSFGVLVLELVSGEKNSSFSRDPNSKDLLDWAFKLYKNQKSMEIMDPALASSAEPGQVAVCIQLGLLCVQSDPSSRPDMSQVIMILSGKTSILEEPARPGRPGLRQRINRTQTPSCSDVGVSRSSHSRSFDSISLQTTPPTSRTDHSSPKSDPHGKRPIRY